MKKNNKDNYLKISKDILELAKEINNIYDMEYNNLKPQVDFIIKNRMLDLKLIEKVLERLLIPTDKCYELFKKLCYYTATFNSNFAYEYLNLYDELYGEEEQSLLKK